MSDLRTKVEKAIEGHGFQEIMKVLEDLYYTTQVKYEDYMEKVQETELELNEQYGDEQYE